MTGEETAQAVIMSAFLLVVLSSLLSRRLPIGQVWRMLLGWLAIFAVAVAIYAYRNEASAIGRRMQAALDPKAGEQRGETLRIPMSDDGHFWVRGQVNGRDVRFLVDSGATTTALSSAVADETGVDRVGGLPLLIDTANGTIAADRVRIDRLSVGGIERSDFAAITASGFGDTSVLGMNFLSSLDRWGVEGRTLVLVP